VPLRPSDPSAHPGEDQRWVESWLAARGLTKEEFDVLPPDQHEALAKEMAEDLKKAAQQKHL